MIHLYLLLQTVCQGYDTYDSAVVAAESPERAREIHPSSGAREDGWWKDLEGYFDDWPGDLEKIEVEELGLATDQTFIGVICASFNAG